MTLDQNWFSEAAAGYAMSLEIERRLHAEQTPYQKIEIYQTRSFGRLMTLDGITMLTSRDNYIYHEMLSHTALFHHPAPRAVAIVGGGDCGALREVLRHATVKQVTQIELDERVTRVSERFFPELCERNQDPRVSLIFADAVEWMRTARANSFDVIILDTTDPVGQAKRLFAEPFYRDCLNALCAGGILAAQSESPLLDMPLLRGMRTALKQAGFGAVQTLQFPVASYLSGWWTATQASKGGPFGAIREQAARNKSFSTKYYNAEAHRASLVLPEFVLRTFAEDH